MKEDNSFLIRRDSLDKSGGYIVFTINIMSTNIFKAIFILYFPIRI